MGTSFAQVMDYLYSGVNTFAGNTTLLQVLTAVDPMVALSDTLTVTDTPSQVTVGRPDYDQEQASDGTAEYQVMGQQKLTEDYRIQCYIECYRDGPAVKPARDAVIALYDAFVHWVWQDPTFGGALKDGRTGNISGFSLNVMGGTTDSNGDQRVAVLSFFIAAKNHYIP